MNAKQLLTVASWTGLEARDAVSALYAAIPSERRTSEHAEIFKRLVWFVNPEPVAVPVAQHEIVSSKEFAITRELARIADALEGIQDKAGITAAAVDLLADVVDNRMGA